VLHYLKEKFINYGIINKSMPKCPISTLLYIAKLSIKDKIQDILKLHNNIDMRLTITVKDKDGKIIKVHKQKSHSFVANFMYMLGSFFTLNLYSWTDVSGTGTTFYNGAVNYTKFLNINCNSPGNCGIVIGTGTATPTPQDYKLGNKIANGTGSGQMVYNSLSYTNPTVSGNTISMTFTQTFTNQSGAPITVTEVGIQTYNLNSSDNADYALIVHDLLSSPITVPNNGVLGITYTISVTT
jgi:hypothetical protein